RIDADAGLGFSFSDDSASALAVLGVNSYFDGTDARNVQVRQSLKDDPTQLQAGRTQNGVFVENGNALALAGLQDTALQSLGNQPRGAAWSGTVQEIGIRTSAADTTSKATTIVRQSLEAQQASVSGVSVDEESVNLLNFQQTYQGAAKFISVVNEMTQTLM